MSTMDEITLTEFLLARITEDEAVARADRWPKSQQHVSVLSRSDEGGVLAFAGRVLVECKAKRDQIKHLIDFMEGDYAPWNETQLQIMAEVYADHEDYRQEWRP